MSIFLETSIGEAIDKLSILDIKLSKINDDRKINVKKEYDYLCNKLNEFIEIYDYFYKILIKINKEIWELQDIIRSESTNKNIFYNLCDKILNLNDSRYLVKKKINEICNSNFKEQKGYKLRILNIKIDTDKKIINILNGAIRYYSFFYDEILLFINSDNFNHVSEMFINDPFIKINNIDQPINNEYDLINIQNINIEKRLTHSFLINQINELKNNNDIVSELYYKLNLDVSIYDEYRY